MILVITVEATRVDVADALAKEAKVWVPTRFLLVAL